MVETPTSAPKNLWRDDSFRFIKPEEFETLGVIPSDIPPGTFPALRHPLQIRSRFGGNAYGFGLFEVAERLEEEDLILLQKSSLGDSSSLQEHYEELNEIYKKIGLLIRFSSLGKPYYLIPAHLVSNSLTYIKAKVDEISKIVGYHRSKFLKEQQQIGVLTHLDDLVIQELSFRFKEHRFVAIESFEKLKSLDQAFDLIILTRDLYETIILEKSNLFSLTDIPKKRLERFTMYLLWRIFNQLKPEGEIFIIAARHTPKTNRNVRVRFKKAQEGKSFALFTHIFKTKRRYHVDKESLEINIFDFQKYLSELYVEQDVILELLHGRSLEDVNLSEINQLPYLDYPLQAQPFLAEQEKTWSKMLATYFDQTFLKPLVPESVRSDWTHRFVCPEYEPNYMIMYLGQRKPMKMTIDALKREVMESRIPGCSTNLLADYRNSFDYLIRTLKVLQRFRKANRTGQPAETFADRLEGPLENKKRRFHALNHVMKLLTKVQLLEKIQSFLNPDQIDGAKTRILENIEALPYFGFSYDELKEIYLIALGHTAMGRIVSGKMNEKALKPISDLARTYDAKQALNMLRYFRLMTMAEIEASQGSQLTSEQLNELFDLYESSVRVVVSRDLDWGRLLDERIASMGGIHNKSVQKLLKMMNHFEFLNSWSELRHKGRMEKESLADYDDQKLSRIENVIKLIDTIEQFETRYLRSDPLQVPAFYRKFLETEFHGTGHLFERLDSRWVFTLLWITLNVAQTEIINFNPILGDLEPDEIEMRVTRIEKEAASINTDYLDLNFLRDFSDQVYQNQSSSIAGTGFQLKVDIRSQTLEVRYLDMDRDIQTLESLTNELAGIPISEIPMEKLNTLERLFSNLESFYRSHPVLTESPNSHLKLPARQKRWYQKTKKIRDNLKRNFLHIIFGPDNYHTNLERLYNTSPSVLNFVLPEFMALKDVIPPGRLYLSAPLTNYLFTAAKKFQALERHDRDGFQDMRTLHRLAQKEFGPMATGIVGVNETQIKTLEHILESLREASSLYEALIASLMFQEVGQIPALRSKYREAINLVHFSQAGAKILQEERIAQKYHFSEETASHLLFLVRHHSLLHDIFRGELSFFALRPLIDHGDAQVFDAVFLLSFINLSAIREDLILEDFADRLFRIRVLCRSIIQGQDRFESKMEDFFIRRGNVFYALENYQMKGLPHHSSARQYLRSQKWHETDRIKCIQAGQRIASLERLFRLRAIRSVEFFDLAQLMFNVPLRFIYKQRRFSSIGYARFEKEVFEALRVYNTLQNLAEGTRHFILDHLIDDKVRIFGYENVSSYLSYENQIKLLLVALQGAETMTTGALPVSIGFLHLSEAIPKRYEALNAYLNALPIEKIEDKNHIAQLFAAKVGLILSRNTKTQVLSVDFCDYINISQKISYLKGINHVDQLKNYFHYSLRSLRKHRFNTEDFELQLEKAYEERLYAITDNILNQTKKQMDLIGDFEELHNLVDDLSERSLEIGFTAEQRHRLGDLYELRKDSLKREKLLEIERVLATIQDDRELRDYWSSIKWFLQSNRTYFGKEFEYLIAQKFDHAWVSIHESH
jgi:hypothetical protein